MDEIKNFVCNLFNYNFKQIGALLWKDLLIRKRQPWMTFIQYFWPCAIFLSLYTLRLRYYPYVIDDCQFPTRQLPSKTDVLPFFQSYICTIENACISPEKYEEISTFSNAPVTPVVNIVQSFINDDTLYNAIVDLPTSMNIIGAITAIATSPRFKTIEANIKTLTQNYGQYHALIGDVFDATKIWSDYKTFSTFGNILCGKPFPHVETIRFIERSLYAEDYNGADPHELDAMPTPYCKELYVRVSSTNNGKITWNQVKPIIQGKILYGPNTDEIREIMTFANGTFEGVGRLKIFVEQLNTIVQMLKTNDAFKEKFLSLLALAKTPFVSQLIASLSIDVSTIEGVFNSILNDNVVAQVIQTASNILDCFSVDRFIPIESEQELEELAYKMNDHKMFYGGVYFNITNSTGKRDYSYKIRMEIDNTPVTLENKNRFWFPGAAASFTMDMRYHRGFIELQHSIDHAIIKSVKRELVNRTREEELANEREENERGKTEELTTTVGPAEMTLGDLGGGSPLLDLFLKNVETNSNKTENHENLEGDDLEDFLNFKDEDETTTEQLHNRTKRAPQFGGLLGILLGSGASTSQKSKSIEYDVDKTHVFTKQFPYPKYTQDSFKTGVYLAQGVQLAFFFALIIQVAASVRNRIWFRESGNYLLMQIMGLKKSSEYFAWTTISILEICLIFFMCTVILYAEGLLHFTSKIFIGYFLIIFGFGVVAFCYMMSNFFSSASIGSVSSVIIFLITFTPYIVIVALGTSITFYVKLLTSFSIATPFCYAWKTILRIELQQRELTFAEAHEGSIESNDLKFAIIMICVDIVLYIMIGYFYDRYSRDDFKFHDVPIKNMESNVGAAMKSVSKSYAGNGTLAVENASIIFKRNFITCLLGRNGTGKSTIIKLLTGQIAPTSGTVYWPQNLDQISGNESRDKIGLCPQNTVLIPNLTPKEHLQLYASIKLDDRQDAEVQKVLKSLKFGNYEEFLSQNLSGGYKRRLNVAIAFIGSPNLVILDEPCSGVDSKTRRNIWELISILKQGRAVVLATHYLDEAEHLSDNILILDDGRIVCENNPDTLREQFTKSFDLHIRLSYLDLSKTIEEIKQILENHSTTFSIIENDNQRLIVNITYNNNENKCINFAPMIHALEVLKQENKIETFKVMSKDLEGIFNAINRKKELEAEAFLSNNGKDNNNPVLEQNGTKPKSEARLTEFNVIKILIWKRFMHFKRNYWLIIFVLLLPVIFEIIAMSLMQLRSPDEYGVALEFSRNLYPNSTEFYSMENRNSENEKLYSNLQCVSPSDCKHFNSSEDVARWLLSTNNEYIDRRFGGISINQSRNAVWFNNKGYHAMPVYLNELNNALFRAEINDSNVAVHTVNHPIKLGRKELSTSSILQQSADAGISVILLVAFSYVIAGCSVYTVTERINGEKLQQRLGGVSFRTYWGVAFLWDLFIFSFALLLAVFVLVAFDVPVFTARENLSGFCLLLFMFGFATIPMVHLCEKLFADASLAAMHILCLNIIIALTTCTTIVLFDVLGDSEESERIRDILNNIFLILPQHALADGLIALCRNYITANMFDRFYIDTYKSPVYSDLLLVNYMVLLIFGIIFMLLNYIVESNLAYSWLSKVFKEKGHSNNELQHISTVSNGISKDDKYDLYMPSNVLKVTNLRKIYEKRHHALQDISFQIKSGECFGLLGANGAGKSTMFAILSGQLRQTSGTIELLTRKGISYCPQSNALDSLLTVKEVIYFYATLRKISNIKEITQKTLRSFHLEQYKHVLVKNLSGGNRRKLSVAVTCFGNTSLILMDEPTSDMDPVTRSLVYKSINRLISEKRSVILTSHTITEIDRVCHRIGVLKEGKMLSIGTPQNLKALYGNSYLVTIFFDQIEALSIERNVQKEIPDLEHLMVHNHCLQFTIKVKSDQNETNPDSIQQQQETNLSLSDLFQKLHDFSSNRKVVYTISECLINQALERILDTECGAYANLAYTHTESIT